MISEILVYGSAAAFSAAVGVFGHWYLRRLHLGRQPTQPTPEEPREIDLRFLVDRQRLQQMFDRYQIKGSVDIRNGRVLEPLEMGEVGTLAIVLWNATAATDRLSNPAANLLYLRDPVADRYVLAHGLDLDHIADAARAVSYVAATHCQCGGKIAPVAVSGENQ